MPTMLLPLMLFDAEQLPHKSGHSIEMSGSAASTTRRAVSEASSKAEHADGLERHTEAAEQRTVGSCRRVAIIGGRAPGRLKIFTHLVCENEQDFENEQVCVFGTCLVCA